MAATCITILKEYLAKETYTKQDRELFAHALDYAPGMGVIGGDLYYHLHNAVKNLDHQDTDLFFREKLQWALEVLTPIYEAFGKPRTYEDWVKAITKTHLEGKYWSDSQQKFVDIS